MDNIKDIIQDVIGKMAQQEPQANIKVERIWKNILEEQELKHTKIVGMKEGNIFAHVDSPAWLYQMRIRRSKILERLKDEIPDIKSIRFKIGKIQ